MIQIRYSTRRKNLFIIGIAENKEEISCKDEGAEWEIGCIKIRDCSKTLQVYALDSENCKTTGGTESWNIQSLEIRKLKSRNCVLDA